MECDTGEGEGESDGQESMERRSEAWQAITEGGWINTAGPTSVSQETKPRSSLKE